MGIAAVYFGCGDTNPVPPPVYTPDETPVTTSPQLPTQITWIADSSKKSGDGGTLFSLYNLANKRASNYGNCGPTQSGSCTTTKNTADASSTVVVADLNLAVADALAYTPATGPTIADVTTIRDSINIINAQAAQRYIARVALAANSPGNGMGGSAKRVAVTSPGADDGNTNTNNYPAACGGGMYKTLFGTPETKANGGPTLAAADGGSGTISSVANPTNPTATSLVNAPCGTTATASGTFTSNTGLVKTVMNEVKMATVAKLPYTIEGATYGEAAGNLSPADAVPKAVSNKAVIAATRGEQTYNTEAGYYKKKTPIACIGPSVVFNSIQFVAIAARD